MDSEKTKTANIQTSMTIQKTGAWLVMWKDSNDRKNTMASKILSQRFSYNIEQ